MATAKAKGLSSNPCFKKHKPHPALVKTIESTYTGFLQTTGKGNPKQALIDAIQFHVKEAREDLQAVYKQIGGQPMQADNAQESATPAPAAQAPTATRNSKGNVELKFEARPDDGVIERLTTAGFKFNQKQKVWYAGTAAEAVKLAEELSGTKLQAAAPKKKTGLRNMLTEIKEAGGINLQSLIDALDRNEIFSKTKDKKGIVRTGNRYIKVTSKDGGGVDQMAIRMQTAGWPVPVDIDGNPDTNAFAQLLKDAVNGKPVVHPDNADKAVAVQLAAELDQISQLTDEDLELQNLLDQDLSDDDYRSLDDLVIDLFDELAEEDYDAVAAAIKANTQLVQQIIQEVEDGQETRSDRPDNTDDQGSPVENTTREAGGSGPVSAGPAGKSTEASGNQASLEVTLLSEVPLDQVAPDLDADRTAADPRTSLPSLDDFSKLFDEMAEQKTAKGRDLFTPEQLKEFDRLGIDVSGVTANYKTEALQQLDFQKEQQAKLSGNDYDDKVQAEYDRIAREQAIVFESGNGAIRKLGKNFEVELRDGRTKNFKTLDDAKHGLMLGWEVSPREQGAAAFAADAKRMAPADLDTKGKTEWYQGYDKASLDAPLPSDAVIKPRTEVVSKSGEQQAKLFATPPVFGKKPQTGGKAVDTSALLDGFTDESTVQPDMFSGSILDGAPGLNITKTPSGKFTFVGKVPNDLRYKNADGSVPTDEIIKEINQSSNPAMVMKLRNVATRNYDSREEAEQAAKDAGYRVQQPVSPTPSVEDSKAAIRAILAAAKQPTDDGVVSEEQTRYGDETYQLLRPHILNLWKNAYDGGDLAQVVPTFIRSLLADFGADIKPHAETFYKEILNGDILVSGGDTNVNHQSGSADLERDSELRPADEVGQGAVQPGGFGSTAEGIRPGSSITETPTGAPDGTAGVSGREAAVTGEGRDSTVQGTVVGVDGQRPAGSELNQRSSDFNDRGASFDPVAASAVSQAAEAGLTASEREERQRLAQKIPVVPGDLDNIVATLPVLFPGQTDDVKFAEDRFAKPDGTGVLFTNGTGTGKTFSGLGIIKRFERQGKKNILIVAPNAEVINGWVLSGRKLLLDISRLEDTKDAGNGIVVTTFANFGSNAALAKRNWDLVVVDEAQYLNSSKDGGDTNAINALRAITLHPDGGWQRAQMLHDKLYANYQAAFDKKSTATDAQKTALAQQWNEAQKAVRVEVDATAPADRTRVVFLSATPFAYHKNIDYANKYLFDYDEGQPKDETSRGYNSGSNYERFLMTHFGYRMRYNKLAEPPPEVDQGLMERQFNSWLKKRGVLSSRMLAVEHDYDRKFVLAESAIGRKIDEGLDLLRDREEYRPLADYVTRRFDYLHRRYLLEAIKAKEVIPVLKQHIALGRKVVVFHDYNQGGGMNPFDLRGLIGNTEEVRVGYGPTERRAKLGDLAQQFVNERADLVELPFKSYGSALTTLKGAFPGVLTVNGTNSKKVNREAIERFQTDNNGDNLIVVQADKGKEGISLHDTTGVHPRVLINLGLPGKPTMAIQQEGRIYRTGQASNAMFRYMNTGTNWERYAFATTLARRASTAENLAMGEEARMLLDAYIEAYQDSDSWTPGHEGEGTGGKERDRAANSALTEWDRAMSFYFGQRKGRQNDIGKDYFATPEPLGLKMVEWADVLPGETVLEPSGGHGAIARWFPDLAKRRAIEPSFELASKLALVFDGDIVQGTFEDHHTINKYDAIVMNPPFGSAGKTAIDHLDKAAQHLKDNGRIVALIPTGPAADKKFEKWLYDEKVEKVEPLGKIRGKDIYGGDTVDYNLTPMEQIKTGVYDSRVKVSIVRIIKVNSTEESVFVRLPNGKQLSLASNRLVDIQPTGPREKRISNPLNLTADITLPAVTFERAGTSVATRVVVLDKGDVQGGIKRDYSRAENIKDFFERIKDSSIPGRAHASQPNNEVEPVKAADVQQDGGIVPAAQQSDDFTLASFKHTQTGETMFVATLNKRDAALYSRALSLVKKNKGYYSKYTKNGAIAGFLFKDEADRSRFLQAMQPDAVNDPLAGYAVADNMIAAGIVKEADHAQYSLFDQADQKAADRVSAGVRPSAVQWYANQALPGSVRNLTNEVGFTQTGTFTAPTGTVRTAADAARIFAPLADKPKENFMMLVLDKSGKPLAMLDVSTGSSNQSIVHPKQVIGAALNVPGAASVWMAHNHPSGDPTFSPEDRAIDTRLKDAAGGSGLDVAGFMTIGQDGEFYETDYYRGTMSAPGKRLGKIPVLDQIYLSRADKYATRITGPDQITDALGPLGMQGKDGLILLDAKNKIVATVEMSLAEMERLRTKNHDSGSGLLMKLLARTNASSMAIVTTADMSKSYAAVSNMAKFGELFGVKVLDAITADGSSVNNTGSVPVSAASTFFSLNDDAESFSGMQVADLQKEFGDRVQVIQTPDQMPDKPAADAAAMGVKSYNIEAFVHNGQVWLVAENIRSISRARELAFGHELAHLGQDEKVVDLAVEWFKATTSDQNEGFKKKAHDLLQEEADKRKLDLGNPEQYRTAVREATARLAEDMASKGVKPGLIQKIVNHLRQLLRRMYGRLKITDQELAGAVAEMLRAGHKRLNAATSYSLKSEPFYSAVERMVRNAKQNAWGSAKELTSWLTGKVTADEIKQLGLDTLEGKLTKQQVLDEIAANSIEFKDVVLGTKGMSQERKTRLQWLKERNSLTADEQLEKNILEKEWASEPEKTHFSQYTEPGAVDGSYREMFVTAPAPAFKPRISYEQWLEEEITEEYRKPRYEAENRSLYEKDVERMAAAYGDIHRWYDGHSQYDKINNPVVRIRFNDREVDGKRILFIEEMQPPTKSQIGKMPDYLKNRAYAIGVKRILAYAKERGYDGVAWTSDQQQLNRWGTERIDWKQNNNNNAEIIETDDADWPYYILKNGDFEGRYRDKAEAEWSVLKYHKGAGGFTVSMKEQEGGNADGVNIEETARQRGQLLEENGTTITSKDELLALIKRNLREGVAENIADKVWKQMQDNPEGTYRPRHEFMKSIYGTEKGPQNLGTLFAKYGGEKVGDLKLRVKASLVKGLPPGASGMHKFTVPYIPVTDKTPGSYTMFSLQENRLNGQPASGIIKEKEQDNGTESGDTARMQSRIGRVQAGHFKDAKALSGGVYFSIPENARRSEVRNAEAKELRRFAEKNGLMLDAAPMKREIDLQGISGLDNFVYHQDGAYIKINKFTHAGTFTDLFINISLHNKVFPEAAYAFEGFTDFEGMLRPVFSQQGFVNDMAGEGQRRDLERMAAEVLVNKRGFARVDGDFKIVSQASFTHNDIVVRDINYRNILHYNGKVIFFDPIVEIRDAARTRENLQSLLFDDQPTVQFSLRSRVTEAAQNIPWDEVLPSARKEWLRLINPLDWSRSYRLFQEFTPESVKAAFGWVGANPEFQAERHPGMLPFVREGEQREATRMQIMLDFLDYQPGADDTRSTAQRITDFFTKWENTQNNTGWEALNKRLFDLTEQQRKAFDMLFVEGDAMGSEYDSLGRAKMNPRIRAIVDQTSFDLYRDVRRHIDTVVRDARVKWMEQLMMQIPDMSDKERDKHIAELRNRIANVRGWLPRDHGEGNEQVGVYHIFTAEDIDDAWQVSTLYDKDGEPKGEQFYLPWYPGKEVMALIEQRVKEGWQEAKTTVTVTAKGHVVLTITGDSQGAMEDISVAVAEGLQDQEVQVMRYMRRFQTSGGARLHAEEVRKDYQGAMPRTFIEGHRYVTRTATTADLSEDIFQAMKGDMALEAALKQGLKNALKRGEIDKEKYDTLEQQLIQDTTEVLLSRAAGRYQIRRAPYLIEGYETEDSMSLFQDYMMGTAGMLSKAAYAMAQYKHLETVDNKTRPWAVKYLFDSLRNMGLADRVSGDIRSFASLWYMGFKISSALINATQPYTQGVAELGRLVDGDESALRLIGRAQASIIKGKLSMDEKQLFDTAVYKVQEMQTALGELSGHNEGTRAKAGKLLQGMTAKALAVFQNVEVMNRKSVILAGYRAFRTAGLPGGMLDREAFDKALDLNRKVNYEMGRHNLPGWARGAAGRTFYSLQSFTWNSLNWAFNRLTSGEKRDQIALLRYAGMVALLGGAAALPGGDELDKLYRKLRGRSLKVDLQNWSSTQAQKYGTLAEMANAFAWHGLLSAGGHGVNASNAMRLQMPVVSQYLNDNSLSESMSGIPGALMNKAKMAGRYAARGDYWKATEAAAPEAVAGAMRAYRMATKGATTSHGKPVFDEQGQPLKYSAGDAIKRGLGFQPYGQSKRAELTQQMTKIQTHWAKERQDLLDDLRGGEIEKTIERIRKYNDLLMESQAVGLVNPIDGPAIRRGLTYKPNKKQTGWKQRYSN